jgi:hypothetical protein
MASDTPLSVEQPQSLERSRQATLAALVQVDDNSIRQLTRLSLPEIQAVQQEIANVFPAGNLPAFVLSGLLKLKERRLNPERVSQDVTALLRGASLIPEGLYGVFVAGPAVALYAYQKLLQLAGMDPASAYSACVRIPPATPMRQSASSRRFHHRPTWPRWRRPGFVLAWRFFIVTTTSWLPTGLNERPCDS